MKLVIWSLVFTCLPFLCLSVYKNIQNEILFNNYLNILLKNHETLYKLKRGIKKIGFFDSNNYAERLGLSRFDDEKCYTSCHIEILSQIPSNLDEYSIIISTGWINRELTSHKFFQDSRKINPATSPIHIMHGVLTLDRMDPHPVAEDFAFIDILLSPNLHSDILISDINIQEGESSMKHYLALLYIPSPQEKHLTKCPSFTKMWFYPFLAGLNYDCMISVKDIPPKYKNIMILPTFYGNGKNPSLDHSGLSKYLLELAFSSMGSTVVYFGPESIVEELYQRTFDYTGIYKVGPFMSAYIFDSPEDFNAFFKSNQEASSLPNIPDFREWPVVEKILKMNIRNLNKRTGWLCSLCQRLENLAS
jgi:hypothetical protein